MGRRGDADVTVTLQAVRSRQGLLLNWSGGLAGAVLGAFAAYPVLSARGPVMSAVAPAVAIGLGIATGARASRGLREDPPPNPVLRAALARRRYLAALRPLALLVAVYTLILAPMAGTVPLPALLGACLALFGLALVHLSVAYTVGVGTGRWRPAVAVAGAVALLGYGVHVAVSPTGVLAPVRLLSPWHWYLTPNPLQFSLAAVLVPAVVSGLIFLVGWLDYRRDG